MALLGVAKDRIYVGHGLTDRNKERPGPCPDARDIIEELTSRGVKLSIGGSIRDPNDPVGRLLFNVLAVVAEFESDLIRAAGRDAGRQSEGAASRQSAQTQQEPGNPPRFPA